MIATSEQKQDLYNYLNDIFRYCETLTEVYDHILTAVENYNGESSFQELVTQIIQEDFGGAPKLIQLEHNLKKNVTAELRNRVWKTFLSNIKYKGTFLAASVLILYLYYHVNLIRPTFLLAICITFLALTTIQFFYIHFKTGYINKDKKASLKDQLLTNLFNFPNRSAGLVVGLVLPKAAYMIFPTPVSVFIVLMFYVLLPVFVWSYYQAFKKEYILNLN